MASHRRLLAVFAHPDDETFGSGSTLARCADRGIDITVVCATQGEAGEIAPGSDATPETLGEVRESELRSALKVLGVRSLILLGYRDSGMAGSEDNKKPLAFINVPMAEAVERLVGIIKEWQPQVIATTDPSGGYGHPDHIRVAELTTQAFKVASNSSTRSRMGEEHWKPQKLYYHVFPRSQMMKWFQYIREHDPDNDMAKVDPNTVGVEDEAITTILDVSNYVDIRLKAVAQHRSQRSPFTTLPRQMTNEVLCRDYWIRAAPPWTGGEPETDLFDGL
ncbi:PIG-L family deacetylase [Chloroflexota bacterium]